MSFTSRAVLTVGCVAVMGVSAVGPAFAASSLSVGSGQILAKGAGLSVPLTFVCDVGNTYHLDVSVTQGTGKHSVTGSQGSGAAQSCTGDSQTRTLTFTAQGGKFKHGPAVAEASLLVCDAAQTCQSLDQGGEIQLQ